MGGEGTMAHMIRSLAYNNGLKQKKNPFKKAWGTSAAQQDDYSTYSDPQTAVSKPKPARKRQSPQPIYTTGDRANIYAAVMVGIAVLWVVIGLWGLPLM